GALLELGLLPPPLQGNHGNRGAGHAPQLRDTPPRAPGAPCRFSPDPQPHRGTPPERPGSSGTLPSIVQDPPQHRPSGLACGDALRDPLWISLGLLRDPPGSPGSPWTPQLKVGLDFPVGTPFGTLLGSLWGSPGPLLFPPRPLFPPSTSPYPEHREPKGDTCTCLTGSSLGSTFLEKQAPFLQRAFPEYAAFLLNTNTPLRNAGRLKAFTSFQDRLSSCSSYSPKCVSSPRPSTNTSCSLAFYLPQLLPALTAPKPGCSWPETLGDEMLLKRRWAWSSSGDPAGKKLLHWESSREEAAPLRIQQRGCSD
ncbi:hypothetical protein DV515_00019470, partial [Chloebia gouldiae]